MLLFFCAVFRSWGYCEPNVFAAVLGPGAAVRRPQNVSGGSSGLPDPWKAGAIEQAAVDLLYSIAQAGSGGPCTEQAGLGWLGWLVGWLVG